MKFINIYTIDYKTSIFENKILWPTLTFSTKFFFLRKKTYIVIVMWILAWKMIVSWCKIVAFAIYIYIGY